MAGDWIKMRGNLWDDPRVARLCDLTDQTEGPVIGALYWLWATADQHTEDGIMPGLTLRQIDRKTGIQGFGQALCDVGWLADHPEGVRILRFEEHNGSSAKRRCTDAQRKANSRSVSAPDADNERTTSGQKADDIGRTSELEKEKRREEKEQYTTSDEVVSAAPQSAAPPPKPSAFDGNNAEILNGKAVVPLAAVWELPEQWGLDAEALGWEPSQVLREAERYRQYWTAGKGMGTRRNVKGWRQAWSNWLGKAAGMQR